jgi:hypothetical protein
MRLTLDLEYSLRSDKICGLCVCIVFLVSWATFSTLKTTSSDELLDAALQNAD